MKNAPFLSIHTRDLIKGFIMAVLTVVATSLGNYLQNGTLPANTEELKHELLIGLGAGVAYLIKNFFTNSNDQFLKKEK